MLHEHFQFMGKITPIYRVKQPTLWVSLPLFEFSNSIRHGLKNSLALAGLFPPPPKVEGTWEVLQSSL